jgi:hypothetical protein
MATITIKSEAKEFPNLPPTISNIASWGLRDDISCVTELMLSHLYYEDPEHDGPLNARLINLTNLSGTFYYGGSPVSGNSIIPFADLTNCSLFWYVPAANTPPETFTAQVSDVGSGLYSNIITITIISV